MYAIGSYWVRVAEHQAILDAIADRVAQCSPAALKAIYAKMQELFPPGKAVGVSDVIQAARESGSSLKSYIPQSYRVVCEACNTEFTYLQGGGRVGDNYQGPTDLCPRCDMPYHETILFRRYKGLNRMPKQFARYYDKLLIYHGSIASKGVQRKWGNPEEIFDKFKEKNIRRMV